MHESARRWRILAEFREACEGCLDQQVILGLTDDMRAVEGVLFVSMSTPHYGGAVVRFSIVLPNRYPDVCPLLKILTPVFHPQVARDGTVDVARHFVGWNADSFHLIKVVKFVSTLFKSTGVDQPLNPEARQLAVTDEDAFAARVAASIAEAAKLVAEGRYDCPALSLSTRRDKMARSVLQHAQGQIERAASSQGGHFDYKGAVRSLREVAQRDAVDVLRAERR